jgi:hypothetical protein
MSTKTTGVVSGRKYHHLNAWGTSICAHGRQRSTCKVEGCGGASICIHGRQRYSCAPCGGAGMCAHGRERRYCKEGCGGQAFCVHLKRKSSCKACKLAKLALFAEAIEAVEAGSVCVPHTRRLAADLEGGEGIPISSSAAAPQPEEEEWISEISGALAAAAANAGSFDAVRSRPGLRASKHTRRAAEAEGEEEEE